LRGGSASRPVPVVGFPRYSVALWLPFRHGPDAQRPWSTVGRRAAIRRPAWRD